MTANPLARLVQIAGAPGSGKSLLITALAEAFRARGIRIASAERRPDGVTVFALSNGGRATLEGEQPLDRLPRVLRSLDPSARLLLAEGYPASTDGILIPTVEVLMWGVGPATPAAALVATVDGATLLREFQRTGPKDAGLTSQVANAIQARVLGESAAVSRAFNSPAIGRRIGRLFRRDN